MRDTLLSRSHGVRLNSAPPAVRAASALRAFAPRTADNGKNGIYRKNDTQLNTHTAGLTAATAATVGYEAQLWQMAEALRGSMDAAEYKHVVLGLIFLKYHLGRLRRAA
ncbi:MAG: type I restriction-modification system subunit M N-terminal domain-containing protein [Bryobacteraceae bacterium]|nr:type I restriction-modification system subunit M N-terminal domain-containing protein [Bryobacteraceae bacterium]